MSRVERVIYLEIRKYMNISKIFSIRAEQVKFLEFFFNVFFFKEGLIKW